MKLIGNNSSLKLNRLISLPALIGILILGLMVSVQAQQKQAENLKRGLIAAKKGDGYYLTWRLLGNESFNTGFNVYRGSKKLNSEPITGSTQYFDDTFENFENYTVRSVINGEEQPASENARVLSLTRGENAAYFDIPLNRPAQGQYGGHYSPNDVSVGDLTGNGEYEIIVKWDPSNSKDNSQSGTTDNVYLDAYTLEGSMLWRINLGPNIRAGAHYTQFMVYDFDGNGKAELMVKTAPGTRDGTGQYLKTGPAYEANHEAIYRNSDGYILDGPEYLTVFAGPTGEEIDTENYIPARGNVSDWGDSYGNRVDRFLAGVAYLDGEHPSAIFARGYYTRMTVASWDLENGELIHRWLFDTDEPEYDSEWTSQGNHQLSVIDVDNDDKQEIVYGSVVIDDDGSGLHTTGLGHGDALHATYMEKDATKPYIFMPHEFEVPGISLRNADDGSMVFRIDKSGDIGRGVAAHLDVDYPGFQFWASDGLGLYNSEGNRIGSTPNSINHVVWWDGELSRELLNESTVTKWDINGASGTELFRGLGGVAINGTKANPNLQADLFGDWREEVLLRTGNNESLRVYTTNMTTNHRLFTFMHDPTYRVAIAWQNSGYNQPPHPGFYVAGNMDFPVAQPNVSIIENEFSSCTPTHLTPSLIVDNGDLQQTTDTLVSEGANVTLSASAEQEGEWHWSGPNNFKSTEREAVLENFNAEKSGIYTTTFKNTCGTTNRLSFSIEVIKNYWGFEDETLQGWSVNSEIGTGNLAKSRSYSGYFSLNLSGKTTSDSATVDFFDPISNSAIEAGDWLNFHVYIPESESESITEIAVYHRHGQDFESEDHVWEANSYSMEDMETDTWLTLSGQLAENFNSDNLLVMGLVMRQYSETTTPNIYLDEITFTESMPTSNELTGAELPAEISLGSNFPNPFNPTTQIPFQLNSPSKVSIEVFDVMGRKVRTLINNQSFEAGTHTLSFDASGLSSGIYFYRMRAGDFIKTRKLNLIK